MGLLPLRAFLGITFVYAGLQKLSDPGFLHKGSGTYVGTQLHDFTHGTPGGFLLRAFPVDARLRPRAAPSAPQRSSTSSSGRRGVAGGGGP